MSEANSRAIESNQPSLHEKLDEVVTKHLNAEFKKPIAAHTQAAFDEVNERVKAFAGPIILDSCCGVGESTANLAKLHPEALVIGIDKSAHRLDKHDVQYRQDNDAHYVLVQADLNDFWRLAVQANWQPSHHYLLYPNPWPKAKHLQRRWHGSAVFPEILSIGETITLRSNWRLYLEEFQAAALIGKRKGEISLVEDEQALTPFEAKYKASGQQCWQLLIK